MSGIAEATIEEEGRAVRVRWMDGAAARFHAVWLRDNCQDPQSRHPGNGQRLFDILDLPADIRIAGTTPIGEELEVGFTPDGHGTRFTSGWLRDHAYGEATVRAPGWLRAGIEPWDAGLARTVPSLSYQEIRGDRQAILRWLDWIARYGFAMLTVPRASPAP